jgi:hypothetical protein
MKAKNISELVTLLAKALQTYTLAMEDGKLGFADSIHLVGLWPSALAAFADIGEVPKELKDLTASDRDTLVADVRQAIDFQGSNAALEGLVEEILVWLYDTYQLVLHTKSFFKPAAPAA